MRTRYRVALLVMLIPAVGGDAFAQERTEQEIVEAIVRDGPRARAIRAASDVTTFAQAARRVFPNPAASYSREGAGFTEFIQVEQPLPAFGLRSALERAGVAEATGLDHIHLSLRSAVADYLRRYPEAVPDV